MAAEFITFQETSAMLLLDRFIQLAMSFSQCTDMMHIICFDVKVEIVRFTVLYKEFIQRYFLLHIYIDS